MTPTQFSDALNQTQLTMREFCRLTGTGEKTAQLWLADERDIPTWVPVFLALLTLPGGAALAQSVSKHFSKENLNG